jgi:hypothetical protein
VPSLGRGPTKAAGISSTVKFQTKSALPHLEMAVTSY